MISMSTIKTIRKSTGLTQQAFCDTYAIPLQTLKQWESDPHSASYRVPPKYVTLMLERLVSLDFNTELKNPQSKVEYLSNAAAETRFNASHWMRYLRKEITEDELLLSRSDIVSLLASDKLTMFQKISLSRAVDSETPTGKYVMSLNKKASTPMLDEVRRRISNVEQ